MLLPGTQSLASSLPLLLFKKLTYKQGGKERERAAREGGRRSGPPPCLQPGAAAWGQRPSPVRIYTSFYTGSGTEKSTPDLLQFFLKIRRWEGENDQRWRCPKAAALNWRVEGVALTHLGGLQAHYGAQPLTCFLFDLTQDAEERGFHSVTVQGMFPKKQIAKHKGISITYGIIWRLPLS